jgi:hypothetical protein
LRKKVSSIVRNRKAAAYGSRRSPGRRWFMHAATCRWERHRGLFSPKFPLGVPKKIGNVLT